MPLSLAELHLGDPEGATCDAMRMLDILFRKGEDPRRSLERVATEFIVSYLTYFNNYCHAHSWQDRLSCRS